MYQYLSLLKKCYQTGVRQKNRTGVDTFMIPGGMMQFDLQYGFPILTTKKVNFDAIKGELLGFIGGAQSAATFRALGTKIWDANANENKAWLENPHRLGTDDLGRIYGAQWRRWAKFGIERSNHPTDFVDQLGNAINTLLKDPTSRRNIVTAWNPGELDRMALPPCHVLFQLLLSQGDLKLHMTMYQRSCDMFLGVPFNISSYALLLSLIARAVGLTPGILTMFLADVHIYENHVEQVKLQLTRKPTLLPRLMVMRGNPEDSHMQWLESLEPKDIDLIGYMPDAAIKANMAV